MIELFLDDCPIRTKRVKSKLPHTICVATAQECIDIIKSNSSIELLYLDHDLGGETYVDSNMENTGMQVVRYIEHFMPKIDNIVVHSMNAPAAEQMAARLEHIGYNVARIPFSNFNLEKD